MKDPILKFILFYIVILLISPPRYIPILPTLPVYPNNREEVLLVERYTQSIDEYYTELFRLTDLSVAYAFVDRVDESLSELSEITVRIPVIIIIRFFKIIINRARPQQINRELDVLKSKTAFTPAYPSGHAFQAYYLARVLSSRYPEKAEMFSKIAEDCALARVYAGLHYPSDNEFSKTLVETFF
jgi:membrane-associated phospholipid phosphatase